MATTIEEFLEANRDFPVPSADSMVPAVDQQQGAVDAFLAKSDESFVAHNEHMGRLLGVPEDELDEYVKAKRIYYEEAKKARRVKQEAEKPPEEAVEVEEPEGADAVPTPVYDRFSKRGDWSIGFDEHWNMLPASEKAAIDPQRAMADGSVDSGLRMKIAVNTAEENLRAQEEGTGEGDAYDTARWWIYRIPIVGVSGSIVGAKELLEYRNSVLKVEREPENATNVDYMRIATTLKKMEREEDHGMVRRVFDIASMLPAYMVEFFFTGGAATAVRLGTRAGIRYGTKALVRKTGKRLSQKALIRMPTEVVSGAAGVAAQSATMLHRVAENIAGQMVPVFKFEQDEANALKMVILDDKDTPLDWFKGVAKGYGDTFVEVLTETVLGRGAKALTTVAKEAATNMALRSVFLKKWLQRKPGRTPNQYAQLVDALKQAGEYQGVLPELAEEVAGDILRGATGISVKGVEDKETGKIRYERDYGIPGKIAEKPGALDSWQDLGEMALAFGVLPAAFGAISIAKPAGEAVSRAFLGVEKTEKISEGLEEAAKIAQETLKETERFLEFGFKDPRADKPARTPWAEEEYKKGEEKARRDIREYEESEGYDRHAGQKIPESKKPALDYDPRPHLRDEEVAQEERASNFSEAEIEELPEEERGVAAAWNEAVDHGSEGVHDNEKFTDDFIRSRADELGLKLRKKANRKEMLSEIAAREEHIKEMGERASNFSKAEIEELPEEERVRATAWNEVENHSSREVHGARGLFPNDFIRSRAEELGLKLRKRMNRADMLSRIAGREDRIREMAQDRKYRELRGYSERVTIGRKRFLKGRDPQQEVLDFIDVPSRGNLSKMGKAEGQKFLTGRRGEDQGKEIPDRSNTKENREALARYLQDNREAERLAREEEAREGVEEGVEGEDVETVVPGSGATARDIFIREEGSGTGEDLVDAFISDPTAESYEPLVGPLVKPLERAEGEQGIRDLHTAMLGEVSDERLSKIFKNVFPEDPSLEVDRDVMIERIQEEIARKQAEARPTDEETTDEETTDEEAAPTDIAEPPLAEGMTRLYHSSEEPGNLEGEVWYSTDRTLAQDYQEGGQLQYADVPTGWVNKFSDPEGSGKTPENGTPWNVFIDIGEPREVLSPAPSPPAPKKGFRKPRHIKIKSAPRTGKKSGKVRRGFLKTKEAAKAEAAAKKAAEVEAKISDLTPYQTDALEKWPEGEGSLPPSGVGGVVGWRSLFSKPRPWETISLLVDNGILKPVKKPVGLQKIEPTDLGRTVIQTLKERAPERAEEAKKAEDEAKKAAEDEAKKAAEDEAKKKADEEAQKSIDEDIKRVQELERSRGERTMVATEDGGTIEWFQQVMSADQNAMETEGADQKGTLEEQRKYWFMFRGDLEYYDGIATKAEDEAKKAEDEAKKAAEDEAKRKAAEDKAKKKAENAANRKEYNAAQKVADKRASDEAAVEKISGEIKLLEGEIESYEGNIEKLNDEIVIKKSDFQKEVIKPLNAEKARIRKSKKSIPTKVDELEEIDRHIEQEKTDHNDDVKGDREAIKLAEQDIRTAKRGISALRRQLLPISKRQEALMKAKAGVEGNLGIKSGTAKSVLKELLEHDAPDDLEKSIIGYMLSKIDELGLDPPLIFQRTLPSEGPAAQKGKEHLLGAAVPAEWPTSLSKITGHIEIYSGNILKSKILRGAADPGRSAAEREAGTVIHEVAHSLTSAALFYGEAGRKHPTMTDKSRAAVKEMVALYEEFLTDEEGVEEFPKAAGNVQEFLAEAYGKRAFKQYLAGRPSRADANVSLLGKLVVAIRDFFNMAKGVASNSQLARILEVSERIIEGHPYRMKMAPSPKKKSIYIRKEEKVGKAVTPPVKKKATVPETSLELDSETDRILKSNIIENTFEVVEYKGTENIATGGALLTDVLDSIVENGTELGRLIAERIRNHPKLRTVRIGMKDYDAAERLEQLEEADEAGSVYYGQYIASSREGADPGGIWVTRTSGEWTILHESMHAITSQYLVQYASEGMEDAPDKNIRDLHAAWKLAGSEWNKVVEEANRLAAIHGTPALLPFTSGQFPGGVRGYGELGGSYSAIADFHEFIADLYVNPLLHEFLSTIKIEGTKVTLRDRIIKTIAKIIGFDAKGETLLEKSLSSLSEFVVPTPESKVAKAMEAPTPSDDEPAPLADEPLYQVAKEMEAPTPSEQPFQEQEGDPTGKFSRIPDAVGRRRKAIRPAALPELLQFAKDILNSFPGLAKLGKRGGGKVLGQISFPKKRGEKEGAEHPVARILIDYGTANDPVKLAQVIAHELGHLIDFLPEKTLKRGNLLGRLHSLRNYIRSTMPSLDKQELAKIRAEARIKAGPNADKKAIDKIYREKLEAAKLVPEGLIREELLALSEWWSGSWEDATKSYQKYRRSSAELYAEALSVFLVSPGTLQERAPTFYREFAENLDKKPEVYESLLTLQTILAGTTEDLAERRSRSIMEGYKKADVRQKIIIEEEERKAKSFTTKGMVSVGLQWLQNKQAPGIRAALKVLRSDPDNERALAAKALLDELGYTENDNRLFIEAVDDDVWGPATELGITRDEIGEWLQMHRIVGGGRTTKGELSEEREKTIRRDAKEEADRQFGKRPTPDQMDKAMEDAKAQLGPNADKSDVRAAAKELLKKDRVWVDPTSDQVKKIRQEIMNQLPDYEIANPGGFTKKTAAEQIDAMAKKMGPRKFAEMDKLMKKFHDLVFEVMEKAKDAGVITEDIFDNVVVKNRDNYAAFSPLHHIENFVSYHIRKQVGSFEQVGNPFDFTIMKIMSMNRMINVTRAQNAISDLLMEQFTEEDGVRELASEAFSERGEGGKPGRMNPNRLPRPDKGHKWLVHLRDGKHVAHHIPAEMVDAFMSHDTGQIGAITQFVHNRFYRYAVFPLYILLSPYFHVRNFSRDFSRTYSRLGELGAKRAGEAGHGFKKDPFSLLDIRPKGMRPSTRQEKITFADILGALWQEKGNAWKAARGLPTTAHMKEMLKDKAFGFKWSGVKELNEEEEGKFEYLMKEVGLMEQPPKEPLSPNTPGASILNPAARNVYPIFQKIFGFAEGVGTFNESLFKLAGHRLLIDRGLPREEAAMHVRNIVGTPDVQKKGLLHPVTNSLFLFFRTRMNGLVEDGKHAVDPGTRVSFWWRQLLQNIIPALLYKAAINGKLGSEAKAYFDLIPEYFMDSYDVIPLGMFFPGDDDDPNYRTAALTIPMDDTSRMLRGVISNAVDAAMEAEVPGVVTVLGKETKDVNVSDSLGEMVTGLGADVVGTWNPAIDIAWKNWQYFRGLNPYSDFLGKHIIPRHDFTAGGWAARRHMTTWAFDQFGIASVIIDGVFEGGLSGKEKSTARSVYGPDDRSAWEVRFDWARRLSGIAAHIRFTQAGLSESVWNKEEAKQRATAKIFVRMSKETQGNLSRINYLKPRMFHELQKTGEETSAYRKLRKEYNYLTWWRSHEYNPGRARIVYLLGRIKKAEADGDEGKVKGYQDKIDDMYKKVDESAKSMQERIDKLGGKSITKPK